MIIKARKWMEARHKNNVVIKMILCSVISDVVPVDINIQYQIDMCE